jgi:hypothetical protein
MVQVGKIRSGWIETKDAEPKRIIGDGCDDLVVQRRAIVSDDTQGDCIVAEPTDARIVQIRLESQFKNTRGREIVLHPSGRLVGGEESAARRGTLRWIGSQFTTVGAPDDPGLVDGS